MQSSLSTQMRHFDDSNESYSCCPLHKSVAHVSAPPHCSETKKTEPTALDLQIAAQFEQYMAEASPFADPVPAEPAKDVHKKIVLTYWYAHLAEAPRLSKFAVCLA